MSTARMLQPFDDRFLEHYPGDHDPDPARAHVGASLAAIDDAMRAAEGATSWPRFVTVLRACGPSIREHVLWLRERIPERAVAPPQPSLVHRLEAAGMNEELRELVAHADRTLERAHGVGALLAETSAAAAAEHEREGEKAAWMHAFATIVLHRVASGRSSITQPSTEFAVTLAVESARDAYAHWATALELCTHVDAA